MTNRTPRQKRSAEVAHVLARAVRDGEVDAKDALRILRHELRRENTNTSLRIAARSHAAQASIDKYAPERPPKNGSPDALHADHVYPFTEDLLTQVQSVEGWIVELSRLRQVVCVTAAENYELEKIERAGVTGPAKYAEAGVTFPVPPT